MPEDTIHTTNPFAMFAPQPIGVSFEGRERGEKIVLMLRAHIVTLVPQIIFVIFLLILPIIIGPILSTIGVDIFGSLNVGQRFLLGVLWYFFVFGYAFYKFIFWYFNIYMLTSERIIDFDFKGVLHRETSYANLTQIEDVSPKSIGFFSAFFHFGNVFVQTAGEKPEFEFHHVPRPNDVAKEILEQIRREEGERRGSVG
ncbi:MAG: PH domain-containing protein [Candidatus Curtissbacteria bacterium]|nr:PH domain-containing protein [Candidatus Curtissbacteria bacterium]